MINQDAGKKQKDSTKSREASLKEIVRIKPYPDKNYEIHIRSAYFGKST